MTIKIAANQSAVVHHIIDGPVTFPYAVDAHSAVSRFPDEWSEFPWSQSDAEAARGRINERNEQAGLDPLPEPLALTPEEQAAIDEHAKAVDEANERLTKFRAEQEEKRKIAEQVAADEALVKSPPPRPDPAARRPFGRKGEPTPAEIEQMKKREAKKAADERMVREKAEQDRLANASAGGAPITG